ncbi:uncharacterized protein TNCV_1260061 [Trichonephila clavipes]|nr:uncharacterized protein TNCV_1260061 [Trichonephila clavipes]
MEDIKRSLRTSHKSKGNSTIRSIFGTKYQPGEDVGIFISRAKTAQPDYKKRGQIGRPVHRISVIRWLPQEFQSTVQQIYRWKERTSELSKLAELILEANRLQLLKQRFERAWRMLA